MTSRSAWMRALRVAMVTVVALALVLMGSTAAFARIDQFGGAPVVAPYAPYTAGPVVREEVRPYAPYTAGPVIHTQDLLYAPYTAGPVVPVVPKAPDPFGHYPYR